MKLVIGNKNYSSWSLRPWLLLRHFDLPFTETRVSLYRDDYKVELLRYSAAGKVPVLYDGTLVIWDSLAICEYLNEKYLAGRGWPQDPSLRAEARSCSAEMHAGFAMLRQQMPMNCRASGRQVAITPALQGDIQRLDQMWAGLRHRFHRQGPWLFGDFSIADCMFAPVAFRFATYNVVLSAPSLDYRKHLLAHPAVQEWAAAAAAETEIIQEEEVGLR